jgi:hypothetical protein
VAAGISWEIYEWVGDHVFHTLRVQSPRDTAVDLISDTLGALTAVLVVQWARASRVRRKPAAIEAPPPRGAASRSSVADIDGAS